MSRTSERFRDEELGAALRELEVPEHRPGFEGALRLLLAGERVRDEGRTDRRRSRRRWGLRLAAVAAVVAVVAFAVGLPDTERTPRLGPEAATAAEIQAQVRAALGGMRNLSGVLVSDGS